MKLGRKAPLDDPQVKKARAAVDEFTQSFNEAVGHSGVFDIVFNEMVFPAVDLISHYEAGQDRAFLAALYLSLIPGEILEASLTVPVKEQLEKIQRASGIIEALFDSAPDAPLLMDAPDELKGDDMIFVRQYICAVALFSENFGVSHLRRIREDLRDFIGVEFMLVGLSREISQSHEKSIRIIRALAPTTPAFDAALKAAHDCVCEEMKELLSQVDAAISPPSAQGVLPLAPTPKKPGGP